MLRVTRTLSSGEEWDTGSGFPERAAGKSCIMAGAGSVAITVYRYIYIITYIHIGTKRRNAVRRRNRAKSLKSNTRNHDFVLAEPPNSDAFLVSYAKTPKAMGPPNLFAASDYTRSFGERAYTHRVIEYINPDYVFLLCSSVSYSICFPMRVTIPRADYAC